jgi:serine protease Do
VSGGGRLFLGLHLVLTLVALATSIAALVLYVTDRRAEATAAAAVEPARPVSGPAAARPAPSLGLGDTQVRTAEVAARCLPSVVNISTTRVLDEAASGNPFFDLLRPFLGGGGPREAQSLGSGVIVSDDGVVLTNHHVVADAAEIRVTLSDGRELPATTVGGDPESDVAVLRLDAGDAPLAVRPLAYGDSSALRQGDVVLAIGNPFGVGQTVTMGIVSATGRASMGITDYEDFIQTDAAINPGNSGGALVNLRGELIGINTAILSRTGGSHGIGFAIPSNMAQPIAEALLRDGRVTRGWLGVAIQDLNPQLARQMGLRGTRGVVVMDVEPGGPAASVDLRRNDVITGLDGESIHSSRQFRNLVATRGAGADVRIVRERGGAGGEVRVTLARRPTRRTGPPGAPGSGADPASTDGATDVGGLRVAPLSEELRGRFGIPPDLTRGAVVVSAREGTPGAAAPVEPGDVVTEINGRPVASPEQVRAAYEGSLFVAMLRVRRGAEARLVMLRR